MSVDGDLQQIEPRIAALVARHAQVPQVNEALRDVVQAVQAQALASSQGGKRLRALLAMGAFDAVCPGRPQPRRDALLDMACAIEVFQTAALVHDDIIDDSDLRRGKPSAHKALAAAAGDDALGQGLGIMLGDLLATACIGIVDEAQRRMPADCAPRFLPVFLAMQREVETGQVLDLAIEAMPLDDPKALAGASLEVFRWKTASYTTIAPLELAFLAGGFDAPKAHAHALAIGAPLGVAFQLADDLLDVAGDPQRTGKPVGGDIREGKRTVLLADALEGSRPAQREALGAIYAKDARDSDDVDAAIAIFASSGALHASRSRIESLWQDTVRAIDALGLPDAQRAQLASLCAMFVPGIGR